MAGCKFTRPTKDELIYRYIDCGQSSNDIAKEFHCCRPTIIDLMRKLDIPVRNGKDAHRAKGYQEKMCLTLDVELLCCLYSDDKLTLREISNKLHCSTGYVREKLIMSGVKIRRGFESSRILIESGRKQRRTMTPEQVEKNRQRQLVRYANPEERRKTGEAMKLVYRNNPALRQHQVEINRQRYLNNPELLEKTTSSLIKRWGDPVTRELALTETRSRLLRLWQDPEFRDNQINIRRNFWRSNSPEFVEMRKKMIAGLNLRPNKPETAVLFVLNTLYPKDWEYTGDGKEIIGGLNPDFMCASNKKIIEVFGDYWHTQKLKPYRINEGRVDVYAEYGYQTLIIWEHETKDATLLSNKISSFVGGTD